MKRAEKDALVKWLSEIADKLDASEAAAEAAALADKARWLEKYPTSETSHYPHMVGAMGHTANSSARGIRSAIRAYLAPRKVSK